MVAAVTWNLSILLSHSALNQKIVMAIERQRLVEDYWHGLLASFGERREIFRLKAEATEVVFERRAPSADKRDSSTSQCQLRNQH